MFGIKSTKYYLRIFWLFSIFYDKYGARTGFGVNLWLFKYDSRKVRGKRKGWYRDSRATWLLGIIVCAIALLVLVSGV